LHKASFFIGVDTAAMHLAAAAQCPTVCLFGPSPIYEYHPWKVKNWIISPQDCLGKDEAKKILENELMKEIPVDRVLAACRAAWEFSEGDVPELKKSSS
jgi:heptosyltransferase-3